MDASDIVWNDSFAGSKLDLKNFNISFNDEFNSLNIAGAGKPGTWHSGVHSPFGLASFANPDSAVSPFSVVDGVLDIRMQQVDGKWQSGLLQSVDANGAGFSQTYGYFEIKAQFPSGAGAWPAFWLISEGHHEQPRVEIDIVEAYSGDPDGHHTALHYTGSANTPDIAGHIWKSDYQQLPVSMFDNGFHTYGTMVTPQWIITYFDGVELERTAATKYINSPFHMIVDLAMTEHGVKDPNAIYDMRIDYIKAYAPTLPTPQNLTGTSGADVLIGSNLNDTLNGRGGADVMRGLGGNDLYYVDNAGDRVTEGAGGGSDRVLTAVNYALSVGAQVELFTTTNSAGIGALNLIGNALNQQIQGNAGNNTLVGLGGNDRIFGQGGNDRLFGGAGNDNLTGGAGNDFFTFNSALNTATNRDVVTDFSHLYDTFHLDNAIFTRLGAGVHPLNPAFFRAGAAALDANDYVVYNQVTGVLIYDVNGSGAGGAFAVATLINKPALAANDFAVI